MAPLYESSDFARLLTESYARLIRQPLVPADVPDKGIARWLYESAPFGILAHSTANDPLFIYGNLSAQKRFEYDWEELTQLPSRLSAEAPERQEREDFLRRVSQDGYVDDYRGLRVTKSGKRFWIEGVTVWQLIDADGVCHGQAAMIP